MQPEVHLLNLISEALDFIVDSKRSRSTIPGSLALGMNRGHQRNFFSWAEISGQCNGMMVGAATAR